MQLVDIDTLGGFLADPGIILTPIWMQYFFIFTGIQYALNKLLDPVLSNKIVPLFSSSWVSPGIPLPEGILQTAANYRRMNQERRHNMVFDQPQYLQTPILDCVDSAEALTTWRYAIQAGAWVYLIEYGVQTGAKHYWFWQGGNVCWKPISTECLEKIRKTGKFPEYSQLK